MEGPQNKVFVLEDGVIDDRARLAFQSGQCHGLALAISAKFGWPLLAMFDGDGLFVHVACLRDDSRVIDITGAHRRSRFRLTLGRGSEIREIEVKELESLAASFQWALPAADASASWVDPVAEMARSGAGYPPLRSPVIRRVASGPEFEAVVRFAGDPIMIVELREGNRPVRTVGASFRADESEPFYVHFDRAWLDLQIESWCQGRRLALTEIR